MSLTQGLLPPQFPFCSDLSLLSQSSGFCLFIKKYLKTKPLASLLSAASSFPGSPLLSGTSTVQDKGDSGEGGSGDLAGLQVPWLLWPVPRGTLA